MWGFCQDPQSQPGQRLVLRVQAGSYLVYGCINKTECILVYRMSYRVNLIDDSDCMVSISI